MELVRPEKGKVYNFYGHNNLGFMGLGRDVCQVKFFIFKSPDTETMVIIPKDEWYSQQFQEFQLR